MPAPSRSRPSRRPVARSPPRRPRLRAEANLRSDGPARAEGKDPPRRLHGLGRAIPFRLEPSDDPVYDHRLVLAGPLPGWIVLSVSADPLAPPRRPLLRILTGSGREQDAVLPGPALGRAHWLGLIPGDARELRLSLGPGMVLDRVGRRSRLGVLGDCLLRRPGHGLAALYEGATGQARRSRDTLRGSVAVVPLTRFARWAAMRSVPFTGSPPPLAVACVVLCGGGEGAALARTLAALSRQDLAPARITVAWADPPPGGHGGADTLRWDEDAHPSALLGTAQALCVLKAGDELAPDALALLAAALGTADMAYADEIDRDGAPRLKPDWSPDLALATGYVGRTALVSRDLVMALPPGGLGPLAEAGVAWEIAVAAACRRAVHVPRPLARTAGPWVWEGRGAILRARLAAAGLGAEVAERAGTVDLLWPLPDPTPLVSVIIPSRDRLDLIRTACRGVLDATDYPALELIVVDNGSTDPAVLAFYEKLSHEGRVRVLAYPHPFNFAAMVNAGVAVAAGEVVVLLNNDIAVRRGDWLAAMVRQALRPEVGAVGAKLLFGEGTLQHAGVVIGLGGRAGHILRRRPVDSPGHLGRLRVAHEVSAVTAACLAVSAEKYRAVGGFDAQAFPVDFNDVDFCLRLQARGWKCVWTPGATLSHFESVSRGPSVGAKRARFEEEAARFTERWRDAIRHDPYYHPALSLTTFGEDLE